MVDQFSGQIRILHRKLLLKRLPVAQQHFLLIATLNTKLLFVVFLILFVRQVNNEHKGMKKRRRDGNAQINRNKLCYCTTKDKIVRHAEWKV